MKQLDYRQRMTVLTKQFFDLLNTECSGLVNYEKIEKHFQAFRDGYYLDGLQKGNAICNILVKCGPIQFSSSYRLIFGKLNLFVGHLHKC